MAAAESALGRMRSGRRGSERSAAVAPADPRVPFGILAGLLVGIAAGVLAGASVAPRAPIRWEGIPVVAGTLAPPAGTVPAPPAPPPPPEERLRDRHAPPADPLPELQEPGLFGALPRVAPDGRTPLSAYARTDPAPREGRPRIALVVRDVGLSRRHTEAVLALPPQIGLAFSPYVEAPAAWMRSARRWGHEVMLVLPVELGSPTADPGPLAVPVDVAGSPTRLLRVLARGQGYLGVLVAPTGPVRAETLAPLFGRLARRGLGIVTAPEVGGADPAEATAFVPAVVVLDAEPDPPAVDLAFGRLEAAALREGAALGLLDGLPLTLERLAQWLPGLAPRGFALVPPSRILTRHTERP